MIDNLADDILMQFLVGTLGLIDKVFDTQKIIFQGMIMEIA